MTNLSHTPIVHTTTVLFLIGLTAYLQAYLHILFLDNPFHPFYGSIKRTEMSKPIEIQSADHFSQVLKESRLVITDCEFQFPKIHSKIPSIPPWNLLLPRHRHDIYPSLTYSLPLSLLQSMRTGVVPANRSLHSTNSYQYRYRDPRSLHSSRSIPSPKAERQLLPNSLSPLFPLSFSSAMVSLSKR